MPTVTGAPVPVPAAAAVAAAALLALTACSGGGVSDDVRPSGGTASGTSVPRYEVLDPGPLRAELLVPDATRDGARAALADWLDENADGHAYVTVQVVRHKAAGTYVCEAEYVADARTAKERTGGRIEADTWPHVETRCPDPDGRTLDP